MAGKRTREDESSKDRSTEESGKECIFKTLTLKLVMLMAILSGQRLTIRDMKVSDSKVAFIVNEVLKTTKPGKECTKIEFLSFDENPRLCVVRYLSEYLKRTKDMRHGHQKLLVSYQKPHRWLKHELKLADIDTSTFGAHSTRAASTSAPLNKNYHGWSSENTFMKYYNKAISKPKDNFGKQLLNALHK